MKKKTILAIILFSFKVKSYSGQAVKFKYTDTVNMSLECSKTDISKNEKAQLIVRTTQESNPENKLIIKKLSQKTKKNQLEKETIIKSILAMAENEIQEKVTKKICGASKNKKINENTYKQTAKSKIKYLMVSTENITKRTNTKNQTNLFFGRTIKLEFSIDDTGNKKDEENEKIQQITVEIESNPQYEDILKYVTEEIKKIKKHDEIYSIIFKAIYESYKPNSYIERIIRTKFQAPSEITIKDKQKENLYKKIKQLIRLQVIKTKYIVARTKNTEQKYYNH